ncbi:MAG: IucA/IucC family protein [Bdellovibrionia bacterium]
MKLNNQSLEPELPQKNKFSILGLNWIFDPNEQAINHLIKCYCRELASSFSHSTPIILGNFNLKNPGQVDACPDELRAKVEDHKGSLLCIKFSHIAVDLAVAVNAEASLTGVHEYLGLCFYKKSDSAWARITPLLLARFIYDELNHFYQAHPEPDFLVHIQDSLRVSQYIFEKGDPTLASPSYLSSLSNAQSSFIESEQALVFGHPFHPSPKSRLGFAEEEIKKYSPEFKANFQLDYFLIRKEFLLQESLLPETCDQITRKYSPQISEVDSDFAVLPSHPWQAKYLLQLPVVQEALSQDKLRYLGASGMPYFATSSVRTLFSHENPYFYKLSLNVRITNCIRRNALHELQGSIAVSRIISSLKNDFQKRYPHFHVLDEPAFITANFSPTDPEPNLIVTDGFGMLLRTTFDQEISPDASVLLTGSLFGNQSLGRSRISEVIPNDRETWFTQYLDLLVRPLFDLFFEEGVMFEPHLQNSLVGLQNGTPTGIWIRDFDNTRIIASTRSEKLLQSAPKRVIDEFTYDPTQAWKRFIYCLLVNHLCEAIYQLAFKNAQLETKLWRILKETLIHHASKSLNAELKRSIESLLQGESLPAKANLLTRFTRTTDSKASYMSIPNPLNDLGRRFS